jgi:hypothetical protein
MDDYRQQYLDAVQRTSDLQRQLAASESLLIEARTATAAARDATEQASAMRQVEIESLRRDLKVSQEALLGLSDVSVSQADVGRLNAELEAYKANNTKFVEALQACADCTKSQAQQIAAAALGQPVD